jgi:cytochrome c biogenesis protein CcmG, thiol:disulfide interchange protein DsbE
MSDQGLDTDQAPPPSSRLARRLIFLLVPALFFVSLFAVYLLGNDKPVPGSQAPDFTARYLDDSGSFSLSSLEGQPVLLNFWASWCPPCKEEARLLQRASEDYEGRVAFVGIDTRDSRTDALEFVQDFGVTYPQVLDEGERLYTRFGLTGQPESFFIDQNGIVIRHVPGALTKNDLYQYLDVLVNRNA